MDTAPASTTCSVPAWL